MDALAALRSDPRVQVRRDSAPDLSGPPGSRAVVYWMQRAHRGSDNPALDVAIEAANALGLPVVVFLGVVPFYPHGNLRHYRFLADAIPDIAAECTARRCGFVLRPFPDHSLLRFCDEVGAALVVGDENPLREPERWRQLAAERLRVPLWTVDADVVVPVQLLQKEQFAARTIRPRIHRLLPEFLPASLASRREPVARREWQPPRGLLSLPPGAEFVQGNPAFPVDTSVAPVPGVRSGPTEARRVLARFVAERLAGYDADRNHPELPGTSWLSPYLHFGHIGPRQVALAVRGADAPAADRDAFLEQLIVRRELSINFAHFNKKYDSLEGCERWALATLRAHAHDPRPLLVDEGRMERGESPDPLWNAAQHQMLELGWMHNYVRMYWAKKILEWSPSPEQAFATCVRLNDKYFLDGRDPNGYTGIAWAVGGKHDRPWFERPIFGTIRYMSFGSTSKKFDSKAYMARWSGGRRRPEQPSLFPVGG